MVVDHLRKTGNFAIEKQKQQTKILSSNNVVIEHLKGSFFINKLNLRAHNFGLEIVGIY
jgi:hypothetical protein